MKGVQSGLTLVELIIIMVFIGALTYVAISGFSDSTLSIKAKTLGKKIVADVRYAQESAMSHGQTTDFTVEVAQNRYSLSWQSGGYLKTPIGGQDFIYDIDESDFVGVQILNSGFGAGVLSFDADGTPYDNGDLLNAETVLMRLSGDIYIKVVPETGRCYLQEGQ